MTAGIDTCVHSIDAGYFQVMKNRRMVCGDTFVYKWIKEEGRRIAVLSDGLGSGVKASVLSTLTATMALNYTSGFRDVRMSAETIMRTLPVCSERKISYATFTIVDVDATGEVRIINYDNPVPVVMRNGSSLAIPYTSIEGEVRSRRYVLSLGGFKLAYGDRIILFSDGVSQAGMGSVAYPFGWGVDTISEFTEKLLEQNGERTARHLSQEIVRKAVEIDRSVAHDDITCAVLHYRKSRELLIVTGPPVNREKDAHLAQTAVKFDGKKIICGGTTAKILARELKRSLTFRLEELNASLPPVSHMEGFDLVTEGIITLHEVQKLLKSGRETDTMPPSPARDIVETILESDRIHFLTGTRINEAWQDPELPDDIGLRRTIVNGIMKLAEVVYNKETRLTYV